MLIATAFVHLLPTAFISLGDPCLSGFWTTDYPAMPGAIALGAIFFVTVIERIFSPSKHICGTSQTHHHRPHVVPMPSRALGDSGTASERPRREESADNLGKGVVVDSSHIHSDRGPLCGRSISIGRELARMSAEIPGTDQVEFSQREKTPHSGSSNASVEEQATDDMAPISLTPEQKHRKMVLQCMLLEMGILFHSVFIGMALSVSVGNEFVVLLIAITFHRTLASINCGT